MSPIDLALDLLTFIMVFCFTLVGIAMIVMALFAGIYKASEMGLIFLSGRSGK